MKKMRKDVKNALCMAPSVVMRFTGTGMTVFAEENIQSEETQPNREKEQGR